MWPLPKPAGLACILAALVCFAAPDRPSHEAADSLSTPTASGKTRYPASSSMLLRHKTILFQGGHF